MLFYLLIFFMFSLISHSINISLLKGFKLQYLAFLFPSLICLSLHEFSLSQNNQILEWFMKQDQLVSGIAIFQTFEALLIIAFTVLQIKSYYKLKFPTLWKYISIFPSIQLVIGLVFFQTYFFIKIDGVSFVLLSALFFIGSLILIWLFTFGVQALINEWAIRAELKALSGIFQLLLAMFLPQIAKGQSASFAQITVDFTAMSITFILIAFMSYYGYHTFKTYNSRIYE